MSVRELNRDQLIKLKQRYYIDSKNSSKDVSWFVLANANELVSDEEIFDNYEDVYFTSDDFFCTCE